MTPEPIPTRYSDSPGLPPRRRLRVILGVLVLHVVFAVALVKALAVAGVIEDPIPLTRAVTVTLPPPPPPSPTPSQSEAAGKAAPEAAKATPREAAAPKPKIPVKPRPAPPTPGKGRQDSAGAGSTGAGSGAGGIGTGTGSGGNGTGMGGGLARPAEKIAGDINSIRDYPKAGRDIRLGHSVTIEMTVGTDGRAHGCHVVAGSGDARSDEITCRLATERFRFRPRINNLGVPVETIYRWQQRFFVP